MWLNRILIAYAWGLGLALWGVICLLVMIYGSGG